jgi:Cu+-exporting ATPase
VDEAKALRAERGGQTFYFCSEHGQKTFLAETQPANVAKSSCCGGHEHHGHGDATVKPSSAAKYFCPMCPGVESDKPGDCRKCGMALERNPTAVAPATAKTIYTCPMHSEVQQDHPGNCPKCGMALEPRSVSVVEEDNPELADMTRQFWIGGALALPVFVLAMAHAIPSLRHESWVMGYNTSRWIQFVLSTPVVRIGGDALREAAFGNWRIGADFAMVLSSLFHLIVGAGILSLDPRLSRKQSDHASKP